MNIARPDNEADLICEALVKEISRGARWCAIVEAWQALLKVRRMSKDMAAERAHLSGAGVQGQQAAFSASGSAITQL